MFERAHHSNDQAKARQGKANADVLTDPDDEAQFGNNISGLRHRGLSAKRKVKFNGNVSGHTISHRQQYNGNNINIKVVYSQYKDYEKFTAMVSHLGSFRTR